MILREKNLPAIKKKATFQTRIPRENEHSRRKESSSKAAEKRACPLDTCLNLKIMRESLRSGQRLRTMKNFKIISRQGRFFKGKLLNLWFLGIENFENLAGETGPMLGIVVNRKVEARATRRNLWKRRIREIFRRYQGKISPEIVMLIQVAKRTTLLTDIPSYEMLEKDMRESFYKAGIFK